MKKILLLILFFLFSVTLSFAQSSVENKNKLETDKLNSPVKILYKPRATYPSTQNGTICVTGTVTLKVTFLDSGRIGRINIVSGLPYGLSENAVEAAKKISFTPARKNGKAVSVSKTITYNFTIY